MKIRTVLSSFLALLSTIASAQSDSLYIPSMKEVYRQNRWLTGSNPIGLSFNTFRSFSVAEAIYSHSKGNLGNAALPTSADTYSVYSESFQKMGKMSLYGKLGYALNQNRQINWNGMTGDYWQGANLCDSIPGKHNSEQYQLVAAFSLPIRQHWLIGAQFDYRVELTAKGTDPRHKNQWMDWRFTPGIGYQYESVRLGGSLHYASQKEAVNYRNIGIHTTYPILVAYPLGFFKTLSADENADWHYAGQEAGGAVQLDFTRHSLQLFQQLKGSIAEQDIVSDRIKQRKEGETSAWEVSYQGKLKWERSHVQHEWEWQAKYYQAENYDPIQQQEATGVWQSFGNVLRSTKHISEYALIYGFYQLRDAWNRRFSLVSGIHFRQEESTLLFYPTDYIQPIHRFSLHTTLTQNLFLKNAQLELSLGGNYGNGGGTMKNKKQLSPDQNAPDIPLWQNHDRLKEEFEYKTTSRWSVNASVTYTHATPVSWFFRLSGQYEQTSLNHSNENKRKIMAHLGLLF